MCDLILLLILPLTIQKNHIVNNTTQHNTTQRSNFRLKSLAVSALMIFSALLLSPTLKAQDQPYSGPPCPPNWSTTQFCFENSESGTACERTVCITYTIKPDKLAAMGQCAMAPDNLCVTLLPGEVGCINVSHPITNISDWYDLTITVHTTSTSTLTAFKDPVLDSSIENQTGYTSNPLRGGCYANSRLVLSTSDGRHFVIVDYATLGG